MSGGNKAPSPRKRKRNTSSTPPPSPTPSDFLKSRGTGGYPCRRADGNLDDTLHCGV